MSSDEIKGQVPPDVARDTTTRKDAEKPRPPIDWSCLPLTLSAKQPSMILLQLPDDQTDLSGDVGTVGLLKRNNDDTKPPYSVTLDLKGKVFHGAVLPSCTLLSVAITGSEAQVNSSSDSVVHLNFTSDFGEAETMEGALDESQFADLESDVDEVVIKIRSAFRVP